MEPHVETVKHAVNVASFATGIGTLLGWLPPLAAFILTLLGICWYGVQFYDRFIGKKRPPQGGE